MIEITHKYFNAWNNHNLTALRTLFSDDIEFKDWNIHEIGLENVLKANSHIFKNVPSIKAEILNIALSSNKVMAEIKVYLNEHEALDVVDVLQISNGFITHLKAYKC